MRENHVSSTAASRRIPIMVKIWAGKGSHRYRYLKRSLPSLLRSALPDNAWVILIDDQSSDERAVQLMQRCASHYPRVELWRNPERMGPNKGQEYNFPLVVERFPDAESFVLCDDDMIYHPGWLQRLIAVREEARSKNIRGVFTALNVPYRPHVGVVQLSDGKVLLKERQAALNWLVPRDVYEEVGPFVDAGIAYDTEYCDRMARLGLPVICMKPSYVQNIGYFGAYQSGDLYTAPDYVGTRDAWLVGRDVLMGVDRVARTCLSPIKRQILRSLRHSS